jgi:hypothetical protein
MLYQLSYARGVGSIVPARVFQAIVTPVSR